MKDSILIDTPIRAFMSETFRLFSSYEASQLMRYWTCLHWIREWYNQHKGTRIRILDLGCSWGTLYRHWHQNANFFGWKPITYVGVDANEHRINKGREWIKKKKTDRVKLIVGDITDTNLRGFLKEGQFDIIFAMEVFEHVKPEGVKKIFANISKLLMPEGIIIISGENPNRKIGEWGVFRDSKKQHFQEWSTKEIKQIFRNRFDINCQFTFNARPDLRYKVRGDKLGWLRNRLLRCLPSSIANNLVVMVSNPYLNENVVGRQWMFKLVKKNEDRHT